MSVGAHLESTELVRQVGRQEWAVLGRLPALHIHIGISQVLGELAQSVRSPKVFSSCASPTIFGSHENQGMCGIHQDSDPKRREQPITPRLIRTERLKVRC